MRHGLDCRVGGLHAVVGRPALLPYKQCERGHREKGRHRDRRLRGQRHDGGIEHRADRVPRRGAHRRSPNAADAHALLPAEPHRAAGAAQGEAHHREHRRKASLAHRGEHHCADLGEGERRKHRDVAPQRGDPSPQQHQGKGGNAGEHALREQQGAGGEPVVGRRTLEKKRGVPEHVAPRYVAREPERVEQHVAACGGGRATHGGHGGRSGRVTHCRHPLGPAGA